MPASTKSKVKNELTSKSVQMPTVESVLAFIGVTRGNTRKDAYDHWKRFVELVKMRSGANWYNDLRLKLRSWLAIDYRYIGAYLDACLSWGVMEMRNGCLFFVGIPEDAEIPTELSTDQLKEELAEENKNRNKLGKPELTMEEWRKRRDPRFRPVE